MSGEDATKKVSEEALDDIRRTARDLQQIQEQDTARASADDLAKLSANEGLDQATAPSDDGPDPADTTSPRAQHAKPTAPQSASNSSNIMLALILLGVVLFALAVIAGMVFAQP